MSTFRVLIDTENASFRDPSGEYDPFTEGMQIAAILRQVASRIECDPDIDHALKDVNGNIVGRAQFVQSR